jgi:predicted nucleic acid-binding protein
MTVVVDSSVVVAALVDGGSDGSWAQRQLTGQRLIAPQHMPVEVANVLRKSALIGEISRDTASLAHQELLELRVTLFGYRGLGHRVWELRDNVSAYDAWYVALAEHLEAPLITLDRKLTRASGPLCQFHTPRAAYALETGME